MAARNSVRSLKRAFPAMPARSSQRRRLSTASRPSSSASHQSRVRRTPSGTPMPISYQADTATRSEVQIEDEDEDDVLDHRILAIDRGKKSVGCSYYVARESVLYCMEDIDGPEDEILNCLKLDIRPTIILLSPRLEMPTQESQRTNQFDLSESEDPVLPYKLELRPSSDFKYDTALQKLSTISTFQNKPGVVFLVPGDEERWNQENHIDELGFSTQKGHFLHASGCVNFETRVSIGCAGSIVTYLQRKRAEQFLPGDPAADDAFRILRLEVFSLHNTMLVNSDTLAALQILQPESHPNAAKQGPGTSDSKESLSIYGLFLRFARTPQGKELLRKMFVNPSTNLHMIKDRHDSVAVFSSVENRDALQKLSKNLANIKNMDRVVTILHKGIEGGNNTNNSIKSGVWSSLLDFCYHCIEICETLQEVNGIQLVPLYHRICKVCIRDDFQKIGKTVWNVVDREESQRQSRTVVKRGVNQDLDRVKDAYDSMDELLPRIAIETVPELPPDMPVPKLSVVYIPQLGFHITIPNNDAKELEARGLNIDWEKVFTTDAGAYFKNNRMRTLDDDLGDLWAQICDVEIEISHELAQRVLERESFLTGASDICGQLDALLALAHGAVEYELVRPRMVDENVIDIESGRHLIQEAIVPVYVTNDAKMLGGSGPENLNNESNSAESSQNPRVLLLTGPNYSGKSVYLRQVALISYMAQVGCFVPAKRASLGLVDKILTRVTTRETVSMGQSSFMIDLQQIAYALKAITFRSLLVIDEFGKGTDVCDGAGLFAGILSYLLSLGKHSPRVLASTHFHEIFEQGILSENMPGLGLRQMEVHVKKKPSTEHHTNSYGSDVTYLYNVRHGRSKLSYGAQCAALNGIPAAIVTRACELTDLAVAGEDLVASCSGVDPEDLADLEEAESLSRMFLDTDLASIDDEEAENSRVLLEQLFMNSSRVCTTSDGDSLSQVLFDYRGGAEK